MRFYIFCLLLVFACSGPDTSSPQMDKVSPQIPVKLTSSLVLLGTLQDAGQPHIGCSKECCKDLFQNTHEQGQVISLGLFDAENNKKYLFEATPNLPRQMKYLKEFGTISYNELADGIFLTHAHIGHYSGLMYLGKEAMDAKEVPVYTMPRMGEFLQNNGPWSQLVKRENIVLKDLENEMAIHLSSQLQVVPFLVPHRDEYSETVGYKIIGPNKAALFIPDIDKWEKWDKDILNELETVDYAFLDATFYDGEEINTRDISQIPHPFIVESIEQFKHLDPEQKNKIIFIHFNHTNPVIDLNSKEARHVLNQGFRIGQIYEVFEL